MSGPLHGVRVVELAGKGPVPFCAMVLADLGADVVLVERPGADDHSPALTFRGRRSVAVDLKTEQGVEVVLRLVEGADILLEGFRPGVMERLGVGPEACRERNPRLVYGRMTGWGQDGPLAGAAGHDLNYIAVAGVLAHIGRQDAPPTPPLNLVGDLGGGAMVLAVGVLAALQERSRSGRGQVVDTSMVDGAALLMTALWGSRLDDGGWDEGQRGVNLLDSGAPFYDVYATADGGHVAVAAIEAPFFRTLMAHLGLDPAAFPDHHDRDAWPTLRRLLTDVFASRTRDEWTATFEGTDACVSPVLTMGEAIAHPQIRARDTIVEHAGRMQPAPAPRLSRTPGAIERPPPRTGEHTAAVLAECGYSLDEIDVLAASGIVARPTSTEEPPWTR